jgi:hypothetical protein
MADVTARLVRALQECNISDVIWLPRRGGLLVCSMTVLAWASLMAIAAVTGPMAIVTAAVTVPVAVPMTTTMTATMTTLAVAAIWPATMARFCLLRCRMAR